MCLLNPVIVLFSSIQNYVLYLRMYEICGAKFAAIIPGCYGNVPGHYYAVTRVFSVVARSLQVTQVCKLA